jgi:bifunctional DNase/RNase
VGISPTDNQGVAILLGNAEKVFVITVDAYVGRAIAMSLRGEKNERPLTHELIQLMFEAFSISVDRVVINDLRSNTYFARLILKAENEVHKKIIEIDARPSDCLALALAAQRPILVSREVWDEVEDASELLEKMKQAQQEEDPEPPDEPNFGEDLK